jgi:hypothetical protein
MTIAARSGAVIDNKPPTFTTYSHHICFSYLSRYSNHSLTTGGLKIRVVRICQKKIKSKKF